VGRGSWPALFLLLLAACAKPDYDVIIRHGTVYDGSGTPPMAADVAITGERIASVGALDARRGRVEIDARGLAVAPGFVNMMTSGTTLFADGRSQSEIRQGVTLEVMGEGESMGPLTPELRAYFEKLEGDIKYPMPWNTLREGLDMLARQGVSCNIASFIGAATVRENVPGFANRAPSAEEVQKMRTIVRQAMQEGALGVASALIYAPGAYAKTGELIALADEAFKGGGIYISHIRNESNRVVEAVDELIAISRASHAPAEIYHLKEAGRQNWGKLDTVVQHVEDARREGLRITADMYTYDAGATGLDASMPPWVQEGGYDQWAKRLQDPAIRQRVAREMRTPSADWDNLLLATGSPERVLLVSFKNDKLKPYTGKTLAEIARLRGKSAEETAMDLVVEDGSRVGTIYFLMNEDNVRRQIQLPWMSFCSDEDSQAPEGVFLKSNPHPRAYGSFVRVLGKYSRDEKLIPLQQAVRQLAALPARNLGLKNRGMLQGGYYADVVVFDPAKVQDHATYEKPHQYATGMVHVFVNGTQVLKDGEHTGAKPGRVVTR
jgi:N-acyl-D-amino-acid deacylase